MSGFFRKRQKLNDISLVVSSMRDSVEQHRTEIEVMEEFGKNLMLLVEAETPEFASRFNEIMARYFNYLDLERKFADAEELVAENFNDVAARFCVVFRVSQEVTDAREKLNESSQKITSVRNSILKDQSKGGSNAIKLNAELERAKDHKRECLDMAIKKTEELIDQKDRYNVFKIKRLRQAYVNLGNVLTQVVGEQGNLLGQLAEDCRVSPEDMDQMLASYSPAPATE